MPNKVSGDVYQPKTLKCHVWHETHGITVSFYNSN